MFNNLITQITPGMVQIGANMNYNPALDDTINFWVKSGTRNGLSLPDAINPPTNNASILPECVKTTNLLAGSYADSGVAPAANTIWVWKGANYSYSHESWVGSTGAFGLSTSSFLGARWYFRWGDVSGLASPNTADNDWHTFIIYDKRLWVLDIDTDISDANLLSIISGTTPTVNNSAATWGTPTYNITYGKGGSSNTYKTVPWYLSYSQIGTITDGVITWQRKHLFNNIERAFDLLDSVNHATWEGGTTNLYRSYSIQRYFDANGSTHCLDNGYSLYRCEGKPDIHVPYLLTGTPQINPNLPTGYVFIKNIPGNSTNHNLASSVIRFPLGTIWDRSNTTIWKSAARNRNNGKITLSGTSGTADITINGVTKTLTFATSFALSLQTFVLANAAAYQAVGVAIDDHDKTGTLSAFLYLNSMSPFNDIESVSVTNVSGDLAGTVTLYDGYDSANPTDFNISTINQLLWQDWLQPDYLGMIFVKIDPNSCDIEERLTLKELFSVSVNKTGNDFNKVLKYTGDYNTIIL